MSFHDVLTFVGIALPTFLANVALAVTYRKISHPVLYCVLAVITFNWLSNAAYDRLMVRFFQIPTFAAPRDVSADLLALFAADATSALLGGIILWQLAFAMKKGSAAS